MSLSLRQIYEQTNARYHLKLICEEGNLDNIMNWVYISEDISTGEFLQGGELIITTGISSPQSPSWLYNFIEKMIQHHTCGTIINLGNYIKEEDITEDILALCRNNHYPLFTMPWETRIYDITHDYYNRIFQDTQTEAAITNAFQGILHKHNIEQNMDILMQYGCREHQKYTVIYIPYQLKEEHNDIRDYTKVRISFFLEQQLKKYFMEFYLCHTAEYLFIVIPTAALEEIHQSMQEIAIQLHSQFPYVLFQMGLGNQVANLSSLSASFMNAKAAAAMAAFSNKFCFSFEEMGFFKLLVSIDEKEILQKYVKEHLGTVMDYDQFHNSNYTETLYQYLLNDGSVKKMAEALFCHRNTINYRIHIIRETLGYRLEDSMERFELMTAFQIMKYMEYTASL